MMCASKQIYITSLLTVRLRPYAHPLPNIASRTNLANVLTVASRLTRALLTLLPESKNVAL